MSAGGEQTEPARAAPRTPETGGGAENDLLARLAAGDRDEPLRELSERYASRLYDLGLSLLGRPELAERLAAETIDAVASRARELESRSDSPRDPIFDVARERIAALAADEDGSPGGPPSGEEFAATVADVEFRAAVAGVGEEGRGVLEKILGEGLTRAEAGERLGLTVGIVEVRLRTALRAVRDELDARGVGSDGRR